MVRSNSMGFFLTLGFLGALLMIAAPAAAAWRTARPDRATPSAKLQPATSVARNSSIAPADSREPSPSYYYLASGDTLVFPMLGEGRLRVRMRPVYASESDAGSFRYAVAFGRKAKRNLKRNSPLAGLFRVCAARSWTPDPGRELLLGEENRNDLQVPAGTDTVRIWMRGKDKGAAFARVYYSGNLRQPRRPKHGSELWSWRPRREPVAVSLLFAGYDSNANFSPVDESLEIAAGYWPAEISSGLRVAPTRNLSLRARYAYETERYGNSIYNSHAHALTLDQTWRWRIRRGGPHAILSLSERYRLRDKTFFGRGDEDEFETLATELGSDTASTLSEADRFDYREWRYGGSLDLQFGKRWILNTALSYTDKDYNEDFETYPEIYSIDYRARRSGGGLVWRPRAEWKLEWTTRQTNKDYREKFSRNAAGESVESVPTSLRNRRHSLALARKPRAGLIVEAGLFQLGSRDLNLGYWNYDQRVWWLDLGWRWQGRHRVQVGYRSSAVDYENAHLDYDTMEPLREKASTQFGIDGSYRLSPQLELKAFWHWKDVENNSPTFAYRRTTIGGGLDLKY
jgi:hypothetical protein